MKQQIYQNGFYLMIGLIVGALIAFISTPKQKLPDIKVEVVGDSVKKISKIASVKEYSQSTTRAISTKSRSDNRILNEKNLKAELKKHGIPHAEIVLAQAKLESGLGTSPVYRRTNNLFGIRKGKNYRTYSHWTNCVKDYKRLISSRYKGGNYYAFLQTINYAEDPNYVSKLKQIV